MGSDSDLPIMKLAAEILDQFSIEYELTIVSAHRTPGRMFEYAREAHERGLKVIIAGAGGAAHLAGHGCFLESTSCDRSTDQIIQFNRWLGLDLIDSANASGGVPVATVALNGAKNAGILAAQILGSADPQIRAQVIKYKSDLEDAVYEKVNRLKEQGF